VSDTQAPSLPDPLREALADLRDLERVHRAAGVVLTATCFALADHLEALHAATPLLPKRRKR
jgi:hypothetical protein